MKLTVARAALALALLCGALLPLSAFQTAKRPGPEKGGTRLHNGWKITPAGRHQKIADMPLGCALSPDSKTLAVTGVGAGAHTLYLADPNTGDIRQSLPLGRGWNGVVWSPNGETLYVSGGTSPQIHRFARQADGALAPGDPIKLGDLNTPARRNRTPAQRLRNANAAWVAGLAVSPDGKTLYAVNNATDTVYALDAVTGEEKAERELEDGARPYALLLAPDGKTLYVTLWGAEAVAALNPDTLEVTAIHKVGRHPNALLLANNRLFVSCGNDDTVVTLDPVTGQVKERIVVRLTPKSPAGATPNALALSPDGKTLYVANADNNAIAVVDVDERDESAVKGFIPTGWYPTLVFASPDGKHLLVGNGKGLGALGPNDKTDSPDPLYPKGYPYIVTLLGGVLSTIDLPNASKLTAFSRQVVLNTPYRDEIVERPVRAPKPGSNAIPSRLGDTSPIQHVLYIIKENRTYDQVLGDLKDKNGRPVGNGDARLTLFGEEVTPNHHALARDFVLLDNLYCDGEVSVDGHHWSNGAYVPDYMARTWPLQYSGKGSPPLTEALAATPAGRIWDRCAQKNVSYRTYYYHTKQNASEEWAKARAAGRRDYDYVDVFIEEFKKFEREGTMPRFLVMALSEDHTRGATPGAFTPKACVASNDLGLGKIVEAISKSSLWPKFAIFVIEDDAQNGPDHVDAHRTVGLAISPYTRRGSRDSTFYTTCSFLRTMELILGLPPMSQYDAGATPLYNAFNGKADLVPYTALRPKTDMEAKNTATAYGAQRSRSFNFSVPDLLTEEDEDALNRIIWQTVKGANVPYPGVTRRALHPR